MRSFSSRLDGSMKQYLLVDFLSLVFLGLQFKFCTPQAGQTLSLLFHSRKKNETKFTADVLKELEDQTTQKVGNEVSYLIS